MSPQKSVKMREETYARLRRLADEYGKPLAEIVDLALRQIDSADHLEIRKVHASNGAAIGVNKGTVKTRSTQKSKSS